MSKNQGKIQIKPYSAFLENLIVNLMLFKKSQYNIETIKTNDPIIINNFTSDDFANLDLIGKILGGFVDAKHIHDLEDFRDVLENTRKL